MASSTNVVHLEFQWDDKAWYDVRLVLQDQKKLLLTYNDLSKKYNQTFDAECFKDEKQLQDFAMRFRPTSLQLQDHECYKIVRGMTISATHKANDDVRFYDAVIDTVNRKDHVFEGGEEVCTCTFQLIWLYGPKAGSRTPSKVEDICLIQSENAQSDPILALFLKMCREKHKVASCYPVRVSEADILNCDVSTNPNKTAGPTVDDKFTLRRASRARSKKKRKVSKLEVSTARKFKGPSTDPTERIGQDADLGGKSSLSENRREAHSFHFMLIENLEKELTPSAIVDFVKKHLSISAQAQLFPSLSSEPYTRGVIVVDSQEDLQKLADFLHDPAHIVLSSRGRPWVITEKKLRHGAVGTSVGKLTTFCENRPWDKDHDIGGKIKIFNVGTEEYNKGKQLRELFLRLAEDKRCLHQLLALEESKILKPPNAS